MRKSILLISVFLTFISCKKNQPTFNCDPEIIQNSLVSSIHYLFTDTIGNITGTAKDSFIYNGHQLLNIISNLGLEFNLIMVNDTLYKYIGDYPKFVLYGYDYLYPPTEGVYQDTLYIHVHSGRVTYISADSLSNFGRADDLFNYSNDFISNIHREYKFTTSLNTNYSQTVSEENITTVNIMDDTFYVGAGYNNVIFNATINYTYCDSLSSLTNKNFGLDIFGKTSNNLVREFTSTSVCRNPSIPAPSYHIKPRYLLDQYCRVSEIMTAYAGGYLFRKFYYY